MREKIMFDRRGQAYVARVHSDKEIRWIEWGAAWDGEPYRVTVYDDVVYVYWGAGCERIGKVTDRPPGWQQLFDLGISWLTANGYMK